MSKFYTVKNRSSNIVMYRIPESNIRRSFAPGETKKISHEELEQLHYVPGGANLISNYLLIDDTDAAIEFNDGKALEPEYHYSDEDVRNLILHGSLDSFLDALDFAPAGVIELIKSYAISLPMTDMEKRRALKAKTGFNVTTALRHIEEEHQASAEQKVDKAFNNGGARRVSADAPATTGRRTSVENKYKIVSRED